MSKKSSNLKSSTELDLKRKFLAELILMDDIFMRGDLKNLEGRSLVLDCLCTDKKGTIYNIELQNDSLGASPKRARYHSGLIDMNISKKGKSFDYLPESYVIFICGRDVLKGDKQIYHISRIIKELGEDFPDQTNIIYLNTSKSSSNDLGKLIEDFYTADPKKMHSKTLAKRVSKLKIAENLEKGDEKAMTTYYDRLKKQWKKEGTEEGMAKGLAEGLEKSEDIMAKLMGILVEEGRIDDLAKASKDKSYRKSLLKEFQLI